jgi:hypothetical protein
VQAALNELDSEKVDSSHVGSGGASHALVTGAVAGFMSPGDKTKLDSVSAGATPGLNQLTGEVTAGPGTGSQAATLSNAAVIAKILTGLTETYGVASATDSIFQAIQKLAFSTGLQSHKVNVTADVPNDYTWIRHKTKIQAGVSIKLGVNSILKLI